jgi:hypothetical protein
MPKYTKVYDHREDGTSMRVCQKLGGSFYMENGKWDAEAKDEQEMREKLARWGYNLDNIGWEKI